MTEKLLESFKGLIDTVAAAAPKVVVGLALLVVAVVVAKVIERGLRLFLVRVRLDDLVQGAGLDKTLQRIGIRQKLDYFVPRLIYFLLLFMFGKTLADSLGLVAISDALGAFFAYLPNLVAAFLLIVLGSSLSQFVGTSVRQAGESAGLDFAPTLGRAVSGFLFFIVAVMAVAQLKIDTEMLRIVTTLLMAAGALAFGLSFGLGSRDITRNVLAGFYARKTLEVGRRLEIAGHSGILRAITATHTILEDGEQSIAIANARLLDDPARQ